MSHAQGTLGPADHTLVIERVSKRFEGVAALADVSLQVGAGQIVGLIGPNGAGKTTLINLITGIHTVTSGRIRFNGRDVTHAPAHEVARAGLARTFQNIRLLAEATVIENIMIGFYRLETTPSLSSLLGLPAAHRETQRIRQRAMALLERFEMAHLAQAEAGSLAYGHQRRVEMMRAMASDPALVLFDEPVAGMNDVEAAAMGRIFDGLRREGRAVLLVEHNIRFVTQLCDQVYVLDSGRLIAAGSPREVVAHPDVITAYLGRPRAHKER
ncbi:MAG: ABC transporter ATP-binding protein [Rhodoferax sp.]|nr:ABC transporter ATP-binding protein [Rhodoferax sp.]